MLRQKLREVVFYFLFVKSFNPLPLEEQMTFIMRELKVSKKKVYEALDKMRLLEKELTTIDAYIERYSTSYEFDRIQIAEKTALRLGIYEMLYDPDIPEKVAITEALRLCKKFSSKESGKFVNALMDKILHQEK